MAFFKNITMLVFLTILSIMNSFGQSPIPDYNNHMKSFSISSPDVYAFEKYELNPVNHFVGKVNVSIPIFTIKTGDIEYPIVLNYDSGGIKVDQIASNVGLGWSLSKTLITRTIQGANDFDDTGYMQNPDLNLLPSLESNKNFEAYVDNGYSAKVGYFLQRLHGVKLKEGTKQVDFLPDIYNFYSTEYNTKFYFENINNPIELEPKGTKISGLTDLKKIVTRRGDFYNGSWINKHDLYTKDFFGLNILSNKGIKYSFNDCDFAYSENFILGNTYNIATNNYIRVNSPAQISAWHVSEILDTNSNKKIEFIYEDTHSNTNGSQNTNFDFKAAQMSYQYTTIPNTAPNYQNLTSSVCHYYEPWTDYMGNHKLSASARIDVKRKILKKIIFDEGSVEFNYNGEGIGGPGVARIDVANGNFITEIYIKDKHNKIIKQFNLVYGLFSSNYNTGEFNPFNEYSSYRYKRLKLLSVQEVGKPAYEFAYEESIQLPPINSFSIDFAGYYNNSNDVLNNSSLINGNRNPKLYYYPNQFEKSLLPFPVSGVNHTVIPGYFNREANDYAKAWSLKRVKYPTGGYVDFEYESNSFKIWNQEIKGGGVRIKKQFIKDENFNVLNELNYSYNNSDGITSGSLFSFPYFGHPIQKFFDSNQYYDQDYQIEPIFNPQNPQPAGHPYNTIYWKLFDRSNLLQDITSNAFVGYSKVIEFVNGNGKKELDFTSNTSNDFENKIVRYSGASQYGENSELPLFNLCMDEFLITNSGVGGNIFTDNGFKRGKLLSEKFYDDNNNLLKETKFSYEEILLGSNSFRQVSTKPRHTTNVEKTMEFITSKKQYKVANFLLKNKEIKIYDGVNEFVTNQEYEYNDFGFMKSLKLIDSKGDLRETKVYYPLDVNSTSSLVGGDLSPQELFAFQSMCLFDKNNINQQIQVEDYLNNNIVSNFRKSFRPFDFNQSKFYPSSFKKSVKGEDLDTEFSVLLYDTNQGNPLWIEKASGLNTVLIWGYNKSQIIAKLENFNNYSDLSQSLIDNLNVLSNNDNDNCKDPSCKEQILRNTLNSLRLLYPEAMITTYTYDPLIGVTSVTDSKGISTYYEYDNLSRLKCVKDHNNTIKELYDYNFKNN